MLKHEQSNNNPEIEAIATIYSISGSVKFISSDHVTIALTPVIDRVNADTFERANIAISNIFEWNKFKIISPLFSLEINEHQTILFPRSILTCIVDNLESLSTSLLVGVKFLPNIRVKISGIKGEKISEVTVDHDQIRLKSETIKGIGINKEKYIKNMYYLFNKFFKLGIINHNISNKINIVNRLLSGNSSSADATNILEYIEKFFDDSEFVLDLGIEREGELRGHYLLSGVYMTRKQMLEIYKRTLVVD